MIKENQQLLNRINILSDVQLTPQDMKLLEDRAIQQFKERQKRELTGRDLRMKKRDRQLLSLPANRELN